jgi:hypothetical protein
MPVVSSVYVLVKVTLPFADDLRVENGPMGLPLSDSSPIPTSQHPKSPTNYTHRPSFHTRSYLTSLFSPVLSLRPVIQRKSRLVVLNLSKWLRSPLATSPCCELLRWLGSFGVIHNEQLMHRIRRSPHRVFE